MTDFDIMLQKDCTKYHLIQNLNTAFENFESQSKISCNLLKTLNSVL